MALRRNLWDPLAVDGSGIDITAAPDGGILLPDHSAFQFETTVPAPSTTDSTSVAVNIDFVDDSFRFDTPVSSLDSPEIANTLSEMQTSSPDDTGIAAVQSLGPAGLDWEITPDFDDDPGWVPGVVTQPPSGQTSTTTDEGIAPLETSSPDDTGAVTLQALGPAGLDWEITPDFDDDPGWYPGWIPSSAQSAPRTDDGIASTNAAVTSSNESVTYSLTLADLNEQYPGIVWPANWWLL